MAKNILVVVDMQTAEAQRAAAALTGEVKSLGEALSDQSEQVHKFRSGIDDAVEQLNIFGDAGAALVGEINKITDPMKRLALANDLASRQAGIFSSASQKLSDAMQAQRVKLIAAAGGVEKYEASVGALKGAFGLALGGATAFVGFLGGAGVSAINKFIEADKKTSESLEKLTNSFDELLFTFGNAIVGGDNLSTVIETVTGVLKDMTTSVDGNRESIFSFSKDVIIGLSHVVEWVAKTALGVYGFFQFIVDSIQELFRVGLETAFNFYDAVFKKLGLEMSDEWGALGVAIETDTSAFKETERLAELLDSVTQGAEKVRGFFGESGPLSKPVASAKTRRRAGGGGGGGAEAGDEITFTEDEALATQFQLADEALSQFSLSANAADSSVQSVVGGVLELAQGQNTLKAATEGATEGTRAWEQSISSVAQTWAGFAGSFLASSLQIVTAMSGQGGAWKAWQAAGLSSIASVANYYADLLFGIAAGNIFLSPGLSAAALAGGLLLKGVAGAVAGAADRLGAAGGGRATTAARAAVPVSSGRDQGGDTTIILEMDGNRLAHSVSPYLSRAARNGHLTLRQAT